MSVSYSNKVKRIAYMYGMYYADKFNQSMNRPFIKATYVTYYPAYPLLKALYLAQERSGNGD